MRKKRNNRDWKEITDGIFIIFFLFTIIGVLGFPAVRWPKIGGLKSVERVVILHGKAVVVDREKISMGRH